MQAVPCGTASRRVQRRDSPPCPCLVDLLRDELIEQISPGHPRPRVTISLRQCVGNIHAHLPGKAFCIGIAEDGISALGLSGAKDCRPSRRIRNVSNDGLPACCLSLSHSVGPLGKEPLVCPARKMIPSLARVRSLCIGKSECSSPPVDPATTATARPLRVLHWHLHAWPEESACLLPCRKRTP